MKKIIPYLATTLVLLPLIIYVINFRNGSFSHDNDDWSKFGDYLSGFFSSLIALLGIAATYYLGIISEKRNNNNALVEKLKHRAILHIGYWDAQQKMNIFIQNKGNGPLIIKKYEFINIINNQIHNKIFDILPKLTKEDRYTNYTGNLTEIVLTPGEIHQLFSFENSKNPENRKNIRKILKDYKISIEYNDVYNEKMPPAKRDLSWFGRNIK